MKRYLAFIFATFIATPILADENGYGGSYSGAGAAAGAQSQSTFNNTPYSTYNYERADWSDRAPTVFVPGLAGGTNPCIVSISAGVSLGGQSSMPAFGLSGGRAYTDEECNVRETLRLAAALTPKEFASESDRQASQAFLRSIACQSKVMAAAMEMTAQEHGAKYGCPNALPEGAETAMRPMLDRGQDVVMIERDPQSTDSPFNSRYAAELGDIFPEGSSFVH